MTERRRTGEHKKQPVNSGWESLLVLWFDVLDARRRRRLRFIIALAWTGLSYPFPTYLSVCLSVCLLLSSAVRPVGLAYCLVKHLTYKYCVWQEEKCFVYVIPF